MPYAMHFAVVTALVALATAQTSTVTQVFLPLVDQQPLVASIIGNGPNDVKTLAIECPAGTADDKCGLPEPITITAGPSTFHLDPSGYYQMYGRIDCKITGMTEAACEVTEGVYDTQSLATATATDTDWMTKPASTSTSTSTTLTGSDLQFISITITAGAVSGTGAASENAEKTTSASESTSASRPASGASTTASGTGSSAVTSATSNAAAALADAAISGVAAGLLALPALPMLLM